MMYQKLPLLDLVISSLKEKEASIEADTVEYVFSKWLKRSLSNFNEVTENIRQVALSAGGSRSYREVAKLGYGIQMGLNDADFKKSLNENLKWLTGRPAFSPNSTPNFEIHGVALLGISLGFVSADEETRVAGKKWFSSFIQRSSTSNISSFNYALIALAAHLIGLGSLVQFGTDTYSLAAQHLLKDFSKHQNKSEFLQEAFKNLDTNYTDADGAESALKLFFLDSAMKNYSTLNLKSLTVENVIHVLNGIPHSLRRWTWENAPRTGREGALGIKWEIENEYHFQNYLWTILAPLLNDLEDEENLKSLGPKKPRADLCIPSLELIIEVKFMRTNTQSQQAAIIDEIASDASLYCRPGTGYSYLIPVIWDNSRSSEIHSELIQGLERIPNVPKAIIISRPGKMQ